MDGERRRRGRGARSVPQREEELKAAVDALEVRPLNSEGVRADEGLPHGLTRSGAPGHWLRMAAGLTAGSSVPGRLPILWPGSSHLG